MMIGWIIAPSFHNKCFPHCLCTQSIDPLKIHPLPHVHGNKCIIITHNVICDAFCIYSKMKFGFNVCSFFFHILYIHMSWWQHLFQRWVHTFTNVAISNLPHVINQMLINYLNVNVLDCDSQCIIFVIFAMSLLCWENWEVFGEMCYF
jgi:hypothetical protein